MADEGAACTHAMVRAVKWLLTVFLDVLTAAVDHPGHLAVDGIEAQPLVPMLLLLTRRVGRQRELQRLEQARLVVVQVGDGVHRHAPLEDEGLHSIQTNLPE